MPKQSRNSWLPPEQWKCSKCLVTASPCLQIQNCKWWDGKDPKDRRTKHYHHDCGVLFPDELIDFFSIGAST